MIVLAVVSKKKGKNQGNQYVPLQQSKRRKQRPERWLFTRNLGIYVVVHEATPTEDGNVITVTMNKLPISGCVIKGPDA